MPAAALAAPIASSSCPTRTCWPWRPANERAVSTPSAKQTKNSPSAAGTSVSVSETDGVGTWSVRQARRQRADDGDAVRGEVERLGGDDREHHDQQRRRELGREEAQRHQDQQRRGAHRERRAADVTELLHDLGELRQRLGRVDVEPQQLAELPDQQDDDHAVDVPDQDGAGEVVGDPAQPGHAGQHEARGDEQRERRGELGRLVARGRGQREHRDRGEGRQ